MVSRFPQQSRQERYPIVPDRVEVRAGESLRFGVGDLAELHSSIWWAQARKSRDVYIGTRQHRYFKVSLHQSGRWRAGWTTDAVDRFGLDAEETDRALNKFQETEDFAPGMKLAMTIFIPMSSLHDNPEKPVKPRDAISWWPSIATDETIGFDIVLLQPDSRSVIVNDTFLGEVGSCRLPDGFSVKVYARVITDPRFRQFLWSKRFEHISKPQPVRVPGAFRQSFAVGDLFGVPVIIDHGDPNSPSFF